MKTLTTLVVAVKQTLDDHLIDLNTTILDFDDLRLKYENCLVDSINSEVLKNPTLSQSLFAISGTAGNKGQSVWIKDPFNRNSSLSQERLALSQASKQTWNWLTDFLDEAALFYSDRIFEPSVVSLITKNFRDHKLADTKYTWHICWNSIRNKLSNEDPCILFESLITMVRPRNMPLVEWTNAFLLTTDLCEKELEITLPMLLKYRYWSGQVSVAEFKDVDIAVPVTTSEKKSFSIENFLSAASKLDESTFKKYAATAAIKKYCAGLLVPPSMVIKRHNHWESKPNNKSQHIDNKPNNQNGTKPNTRTHPTDRNKNRPKHAGADWFMCFDCKVWHAPGRGNHTAAGLKLIEARYGPKPTAPNKYVRKVTPPNSNRDKCTYCDKEGHVEGKCYKKQRDQKRAKEETRSQEQRPFPPTVPPKLTKSKRRRIRQAKRVMTLAKELSQKHLAEAEENHRLELTASAASSSDPRAGGLKPTYNKPPDSKSNPSIKGNGNTKSNSKLSPAPDAASQPPTKKARKGTIASSVARGGVSDDSNRSEGAKPGAKGDPHAPGTSAYDLEIQQKVLQMMEEENMSIELDRMTIEPDGSAHEYFMLARPTQSYISRCIFDCITPASTIVQLTTAIDSGSSLTLAVEAVLHNLREKDLGSVRGFAGSLRLNRVGDLIIPHPFAGSSILETACVSSDLLPSGTRASIGRGGTNALNVNRDALACVPPSIIARPSFKSEAPPITIDWSKYFVNGRDGLTHAVYYDGIRDNRMGERAFVRFKDGSTSLVQSRFLYDSSNKSPVDLASVSPPACILPGCVKPVADGICPRYGGRKSACCHAHYILARDTHKFIHPGFIPPGMILTTACLRKRVAQSGSNNTSKVARAAGARHTVQPTPTSTYLISKYEAIVRAAPAHRLPTAWMERAMRVTTTDASFVSIFDGARGAINNSAAAFGLSGLPPVDIACAHSPLDM